MNDKDKSGEPPVNRQRTSSITRLMKKKGENDDDRNKTWIYMVISREELCILEYDDRPDERKKHVEGLFNTLKEANKCAVNVFKKKHIQNLKEDGKSVKDDESSDLQTKLTEYESSENEKFNETDEWSEREVMDDDVKMRVHVWVQKEELVSKYSKSRNRKYDWRTQIYTWE